jgi:predicted nucleotidyltransferase
MHKLDAGGRGSTRENGQVNPLIERHRETIHDLCRTYGVARLELFGSAVTDSFDPDRSDVDFIVEYPSNYDFGPWLARFQKLEESLAAVLGRDVDLVMTSALHNRWFNREAAKTRMVIYDASKNSEIA